MSTGMVIYMKAGKMRRLIPKWSKRMKIKRKVIENIRIRGDRAETLKEKSFELSMEAKEMITEADLVNYLIDTQLEYITLQNEGLTIKKKD